MENKKNGRKSIMMTLLVVVLSAAFFAMTPSVAAQGVTVQMAVCVDGSGSISTSEWNLMVGGLAGAVEDPVIVPQDGSVELTIVQFAGSTASLEVAPTVIDSQATATSVANTIRAITKRGGWTPTSQGILMATTQITGSPNFDPDDRQIIDIATNGHPQPASEPAATIAARNAAISAGIDEIDSEAIGQTAVWLEWLRANIVYPQPGVVVPPSPYPDPPGSAGFVRVVTTFDDFEEAFKEKFGQVSPQGDCCVCPSPDSPVGTPCVCIQTGAEDICVNPPNNGVWVGPNGCAAGTTLGCEGNQCDGGGGCEIPEFSTIALPVASILGLLFFFNYRKRRREQ